MSSSDSDDDMPLAQRAAQKVDIKPASNGAAAAKRPAARKASSSAARSSPSSGSSGSDSDSDSDSDSEDDVPLSQRTPQPKAGAKRKKPAAAAVKKQPAKKQKTNAGSSTRPKSGGKGGGEPKWTTLVHSGVLFPPEYEPHGVKVLYEGKPVELTPEQEEVASMFAIMKETDYMSKPTFLKNFWEGFKEVLGRGHVIKDLAKCDFTPIYDHLMAERDKKKALTKEEKAAIKVQKDAAEAKYKHALVDGRQEQVGNFRVEPPSLFRGRGEHPKMGKIKQRVYPRDITINIGKDAPIPEHPYPGQRWKEVRHDNTVTWLAFWKDTVNPKEYKYVWLGATSSFKAESDLLKYEKARKLKDYITDIRKNYKRDWESSDVRKKQMGVAVYFLDKLALRAGHEKDDDEADTVGCCTLKVENVECVPPNHIKFDFLGKDSIRYENTVDVELAVYKAVQAFIKVDAKGKRKGPRDMLFDTFDATDLNKELKGLMDGLSVKVFRTYNASITLDRLLSEMEEADEDAYAAKSVDAKKADYDRANKEVAILCNHQRSVPKTHETSMAKVTEKLNAMREEIKALEEEHEAALKAKGRGKNPDAIASKLSKKMAALEKAELQAAVKEDLKTVALGTSKINYMDPRISIAWCKRNEVPIEKVFNKSLLSKFHWAMDVESSFRF
ncbi:hypothetical protein OEZ85_006609 [Tetradesmus obliquus]|uniref:DNA topoisomerase I n=1 Tax=Tetradesmus obliquus TaxID=3088 RepID=A0ABY8TX99_TETOB|nr:hypothetical protein OEZ85_006609 [Tetradesmus obliquus]